MDVVRTNIEKLGGAVVIESQRDQGTTFDIMLPLTRTIIPPLIVRCGGSPFAVPQTSIRELVLNSASELDALLARINSAEAFRLRDKLLPLVRLDSTLDLNSVEERATDVLGSVDTFITHTVAQE